MKLYFEDWIERQNISDSIRKLFNESTTCYKSGAYKASLLYSYLGLMSIIKERILKSKIPPGIPEGKWKHILKEVRNVESWDKQVFEALQMQKPKYVFPITDTLRREILYWKDRRNDCAHFKNETIDSHHVESLWSFMERNLPKLTINGGKDELLKKISNHFDISLTPENSPYDYLIEEIEFSVEENELIQFFNQITIDLELENSFFPKDLEFFYKIFTKYDNHVVDKLIEYLTGKEYLLFKFLRTYPQYFNSFRFNEQLIRKIWHKDLFKSYENDYPIYVAMIKNNLIPEKDLKESHGKILSRMKKHKLKESELDILDDSGFLNLFHDNYVYLGGYFEYRVGNNYSHLFVKYIERYGLTEKIVLCLCKTFTGNSNKPFHLRDGLADLFTKKKELRNDFIALAKNASQETPNGLSFLKDD